MLIAKDIRKSYPTPRGPLEILNGIYCVVRATDSVIHEIQGGTRVVRTR